VGKRVLAFLLAGLVLAPLAAAQELTPLEKAMRALAKKQRSWSVENASGVTSTAQASALTALAIVSSLGNTLLVQSAGAGTATAQAGIETAGTPSGATGPMPEAKADPLQLIATAGTDTISLSWSNTTSAWSGFAGYRVLRSQAGSEWTPLLPAVQKFASYLDLSPTAATDHFYQVLSVDAQGVTLCASLEVTARLRPAEPPAAPSEVQASAEDERVRVSWKPAQQGSRDLGGYVVWRAPETGGEELLLAVTPTARNEYYDEALVPTQNYRYRVAAVDVRGLTGTVSAQAIGHARARNRDSLVLMSTAYRGLGLRDTGFTGDLQFTYYIGTLYGEQDPELSKAATYLDPISLWLLNGDVKYTALVDPESPVAVAVGARGALQLFAGQQSTTGGQFTFSSKSTFQTLWGTYLSLSRSFGNWGVHAGYLLGTIGDSIYYLSKYIEPAPTRNLISLGVDLPLFRRMNASLEVLLPLDDHLQSSQHPLLINAHVDRLLNFDVAYLRWDQGWALLGYFNIRFTVFPGSDQ
jgi:hypothetical protein